MSDTTERVYEYIVWYKMEFDGLAPSLREICLECGLGSTSVASYHLRRLEMQGRVSLLKGQASRGIMVTGGRWDLSTTENAENTEKTFLTEELAG